MTPNGSACAIATTGTTTAGVTTTNATATGSAMASGGAGMTGGGMAAGSAVAGSAATGAAIATGRGPGRRMQPLLATTSARLTRTRERLARMTCKIRTLQN